MMDVFFFKKNNEMEQKFEVRGVSGEREVFLPRRSDGMVVRLQYPLGVGLWKLGYGVDALH
jgi:hypothetical protein